MTSELLSIRDAKLGDPPFPVDKTKSTPDEVFIADGWYKSWRSSPYAGTGRRRNAFYEVLDTIRDLSERGMSIRVLESPRFDRLCGFIAYEQFPNGRYVLHYLYVKDALRRKGFGTKLLGEIDTSRYLYTHKTRFTKYLPKGKHEREIAVRKHL